MPKKYITVHVGKSSLVGGAKTPLSVRFDSICTTAVNGSIYKLSSRDAEPITQDFSDDSIVMKVNANKSDRIQLHLTWKPVLVLAFSKRILFEGLVQQSPLPDVLAHLHSQGLDIRAVQDPLTATHYLVMSEYLDYNLQIAVLRGIPVVSTRWTEMVEENSNNVEEWINPLRAALLPGTENNYVFPNALRPLLLAGLGTLVYGNGSPKQVSRLEKWLRCLGSPHVTVLDSSGGFEAVVQKINASSSSESVLVFSCNDEDPELEKLFGLDFNTVSGLWKAVVGADISGLKRWKPQTLSPEPPVKVEPESLRLIQRRKRRKVERVSDTDFFLFSQAPSQPVSGSLEMESIPVERETAVPPSQKLQECGEGEGIEEGKSENKGNNGDLGDVGDDAVGDVVDGDGELGAQLNGDALPEVQEPPLKKARTADWIVPQVSLAEAVQSMKKQAEDEVKKELGLDEVDSTLNNLVIVEEVDMARKKPPVSSDEPSYNGRKNFKAFRRKAQTHHVTRKFLELHDDNTANEIRFSDLQTVPLVDRAGKDFSKEMDSVRGFQPDSAPLFVGDASDEETSFSFLEKRQVLSDNDDNDDEFAFKFSRG